MKWTAGVLGPYPSTAEAFQKTGELMRFTALDEKEPQIYHIYRKIARLAGLDCIENKPPQIGVTTHEFPDGEKVKIELNYSDKVIDNIPANGMRILLSGKVILFPA